MLKVIFFIYLAQFPLITEVVVVIMADSDVWQFMAASFSLSGYLMGAFNHIIIRVCHYIMSFFV